MSYDEEKSEIMEEYRLNIINVIKSRELRWAVHRARMDKDRTVYKILNDRLDGKRPLGRPRRRWEDNIRIDIRY
ncbi:hypothetical protein M0804_000403 [Polistes exclamans]|nr:hypothetical protein M0804_000403 [Polistes exclamans]